MAPADKMRRSHPARLVLDVQNAFRASGGFVINTGRGISSVRPIGKRLTERINRARAAGVTVVFVVCSRSTDVNRYPPDVRPGEAACREDGGDTLSPICQGGTWAFGDCSAAYSPQPTGQLAQCHRPFLGRDPRRAHAVPLVAASIGVAAAARPGPDCTEA